MLELRGVFLCPPTPFFAHNFLQIIADAKALVPPHVLMLSVDNKQIMKTFLFII